MHIDQFLKRVRESGMTKPKIRRLYIWRSWLTKFKKTVWPGGDTSLPLSEYQAKDSKVVHKRHIVSQKKKGSHPRDHGNISTKKSHNKGKKSSSRKTQRNLEAFFTASPVDPPLLQSQFQEFTDMSTRKFKQLEDRLARMEERKKPKELTMQANSVGNACVVILEWKQTVRKRNNPLILQVFHLQIPCQLMSLNQKQSHPNTMHQTFMGSPLSGLIMGQLAVF